MSQRDVDVREERPGLLHGRLAAKKAPRAEKGRQRLRGLSMLDARDETRGSSRGKAATARLLRTRESAAPKPPSTAKSLPTLLLPHQSVIIVPFINQVRVTIDFGRTSLLAQTVFLFSHAARIDIIRSSSNCGVPFFVQISDFTPLRPVAPSTPITLTRLGSRSQPTSALLRATGSQHVVRAALDTFSTLVIPQAKTAGWTSYVPRPTYGGRNVDHRLIHVVIL